MSGDISERAFMTSCSLKISFTIVVSLEGTLFATASLRSFKCRKMLCSFYPSFPRMPRSRSLWYIILLLNVLNLSTASTKAINNKSTFE